MPVVSLVASSVLALENRDVPGGGKEGKTRELTGRSAPRER